MAFCIVILDLLKVRRALESIFTPIEPSQPLVESRIARPNVPDVALEVLVVDGIETRHGDVQADIGLGDVRTVIERTRGAG